MKRSNCAILSLGLFLSGMSPAFAQETLLVAQAQLKESSSRWGAGVNVQKQSVDFFSCRGRCARSPSSLSIAIPAEAQGLKSHVSVLQLKEGTSAFLVRLGDPNSRHYSVLALGAERGEDSMEELPAPRLVLKGWTDPADQQLSVQESSGGDRVFLTSGVSKAVCGREFPEQTKMLDPSSGQFRASRPPVLPAQERKDATSLALTQVQWEASDVALRLTATSSGVAPALDGDRIAAWRRGHDFVEFNLPTASRPRELLLQLAQTENPHESQMWLATSRSVFSLELPAVSGGLLRVTLPEQSITSEDSCIALVQPQSPAPLAEAFVRTTAEPVPTGKELVSRLESPDSGWAEAALGFAGPQEVLLLAETFPRLNPLGRERAISVAESLPRGAGAPVLVAAYEFGNEQQADAALAELRNFPEKAATSLGQRLHLASNETLERVATTLVELKPDKAVDFLLRELKRERSAERRLVLREAIALAARSESGRAALRPHVEQKVKWPRHVQLELVRALRPTLRDWKKSGLKLVEALSRGASFREAYLLAPVASDWLEESTILRQAFSDWLAGRQPIKLKPTQRAALSVRVFETLTERETKGKEDYRAESLSLLSSENVRVRASALNWLAHFPGADLVKPAGDLLEDDTWPRVRAAAAAVLGSVAASNPQLSEDVIDDLASELRSDDDPGVRRALVRALSLVSTPDSQKQLRRALEKDEDYKVRAEAARALGRLCDTSSLETLTDLAHDLARAPAGEGPVTLSLAALSALIDLNPSDLDSRVAPLLSDQVPGMLRVRVQARLRERKEATGCKVETSSR